MVKVNEFKKKINKILCNKIEFLGNNLDKIILQLSEIKAQKIYSWINLVYSNEIRPIRSTIKKPYKKWTTYELLPFRKQLTIEGIPYRILLIKIKNQYYIMIFNNKR